MQPNERHQASYHEVAGIEDKRANSAMTPIPRVRVRRLRVGMFLLRNRKISAFVIAYYLV
jgi:hypothetical protein